MKNCLFLFAILVLLGACQDKKEQTNLLVGKWQLVAVQDTSNTWRDVTSESSIMHIHPNGAITFTTTEGKEIPALGCCGPEPYQAKGDEAILLKYFPSNCANVQCLAASPSDPPPSLSWQVKNVDAQLLEIETEGRFLRQLRYRKLN